MTLGGFVDQAFGYLDRGKKLLKRVIGLWVAAFVFFAALPFTKPSQFLRDPSAFTWLNHSIALWLLRSLDTYLLPHGETLIASGPWDAFVAVMYVGMGLAAIVTIPYATYLLFGVFRFQTKDPLTGDVLHGTVLEGKHRRVFRNLAAMSILLFLAGVGLGLWLLPWLYQFAFTFQLALGVAGTVTLSGFLLSTGMFTVGLGLAFEVPTVAYGLAVGGMLSSKTLASHWRLALASAFIAAFVISPGVGGGLIEVPIAILLLGLWVLSIHIVRGVERRRLSTMSPGRTDVQA